MVESFAKIRVFILYREPPARADIKQTALSVLAGLFLFKKTLLFTGNYLRETQEFISYRGGGNYAGGVCVFTLQRRGFSHRRRAQRIRLAA
jgi:hypothetical protein